MDRNMTCPTCGKSDTCNKCGKETKADEMGHYCFECWQDVKAQARKEVWDEAIEIVKGQIPDEKERMKNWDLEQTGDALEEAINALALAKEKEGI